MCMLNLPLRMTQLLIAPVALVASIGLAAAAEHEGHGQFEFNDEESTFQDVSAFRIRDRGDATRFETLIMLTNGVPDRAAIAAADDPVIWAMNDPVALEDHLTFTIDADGKVGLNAHIGGVQYIDSSGQIFGQPGSLAATCAINTETRIECEISTTEAVETADGASWSLQAVFESDVLSREPGKPIEAGGGEPGEALKALEQSLASDDMEAILAHLSESAAADYRATWRSPEENMGALKEQMGRQFPRSFEVTTGEYSGDDEAILMVKGLIEGYGDDLWLFIVTMIREDGRWVMNRSVVSGFAD